MMNSQQLHFLWSSAESKQTQRWRQSGRCGDDTLLVCQCQDYNKSGLGWFLLECRKASSNDAATFTWPAILAPASWYSAFLSGHVFKQETITAFQWSINKGLTLHMCAWHKVPGLDFGRLMLSVFENDDRGEIVHISDPIQLTASFLFDLFVFVKLSDWLL